MAFLGRSALLALGAVMLASCVNPQSSDRALVRPQLKPPPADSRPDVFRSGTDVGLAYLREGDLKLARLSDYALLAAMGYDDEKRERVVDCTSVGGPGYLKGPAAWSRNKELSDITIEPEFGRIDIPGLGYSVWVQRGSKPRVALVFRGTDFDSFGDWYSNLRWLTRFNFLTRDQYRQVRALVPKLKKAIEAKYGRDTDVVAIGHSLGGGLAQQAAYAAPWIKTVYAFNTTPVTGATSVGLPKDRRGLLIYRPYEAGEVLSSLRYAARRVLPLHKADPKITEIRFNFRTTFAEGSRGGGLFGQHRMRQLACDLVCWVDRGGDSKSCKVDVQ